MIDRAILLTALAMVAAICPWRLIGPGHYATGRLHRGGDPRIVIPLPADLAVQRHPIDGVAGEMPRVHGPAGAARDKLGLALTRAQASLDPEVLCRDPDRTLDHPNDVGVRALQPITRQLVETRR